MSSLQEPSLMIWSKVTNLTFPDLPSAHHSLCKDQVFFTFNPFPTHLAHLPTLSLVFPQCQVMTVKADLISILSTPWDKAWHIVGAQKICWMNEWMDTQLRWSLETGRKGPQRHTDRASGRCMGSVQWMGCWSWSHSWGIHSGQGNGSSCLLSWCLWSKRGKKKGPRTHD